MDVHCINTLRVQHLTKAFGHRVLFQDLAITLQKGKITGLLGKNGIGKSTLMQILFGTESCKSAKAVADDKSITLSKNLKNELVGYLPQDPFLMKRVSVNDTILMWYPETEKNDILLYDPFIHKIAEKRVGDLSMGERRFLETILVLHLNRPFIILDEPFSGLAPLQIERVKELIQLYAINKGILISDHYYTHVMEVAHDCVVLDAKKLKVITNPADLEQHYLKGASF